MCDGRQGGKVEGERVLLRVAAHALERQAVHERAIGRRQARGHVAPAMVGRPAACAGRAPRRGGRASAAPSCPRRVDETSAGWSRARSRAGPGTAPPRARSSRAARSGRPGRAAARGRCARTRRGRARFARPGPRSSPSPPAEEVGHELEPLAVPRVEVRAGGGLAVELVDRERRPRPGSADAPISVSVCTMPDTQMIRTASGACREPRPKTTSAGRPSAPPPRSRSSGAGCRRGSRPSPPRRPVVRHAPGELHRERVVAVAALVHAGGAGREASPRARPRRRRRRGRPRRGRPPRASAFRRRGGEGRGAHVGPGRPQLAQEPRPLRGHHEEVEEAVVVVVDELRGERARGRRRARARP